MTRTSKTDSEKINGVLRVENLKKYFSLRKRIFASLGAGSKIRFVRAVDNGSFTLEKGEILGFVGESGCGKSTMSRTILRLTEPTGGRVFYQDTDILSLTRAEFKPFRPRMQMIFQDPFGSLNPRRTVADTLAQTIRIHRLARNRDEEAALIDNTLEEVGLRPPDQFRNAYPALLSGGQLQRVSIGRVLVLQPSVVIADEPISMLDVSVRIGILDLLMKMKAKYGISFIYITHDLVTARYICDRIAIMYLGKIVEIGPAEAVVHHPLHPYTQALIAAVPDPDPTAPLSDLPIKGYVPVADEDTRDGCHFLPRCPYGEKECRRGTPRLIDTGNGHWAACLKSNETDL
jgi:peptide/nickel transport system ATP-binding protein